MRNPEYFQPELKEKRSHSSSGLDPLIILNLLRKNWYWFVIGIFIGLFAARFYISHTMPVYQTSATILINDSENRSLVDNTALLQGLGLPGGMQNQGNQIIKSGEICLAPTAVIKLVNAIAIEAKKANITPFSKFFK